MFKQGSLFATSACCAVLLTSSAFAQPKSLVIGIDGLGFGDFGFSTANTPAMDSLIDGTWQTGYQGAYSDQGFAGGDTSLPATLQATSSGPGWSTILTGVWVDQHDVPNNSFSNPDYANNPSYLETLEESVANFHSASIVNWSPIDTHIISTVDDGNSSMDFRSTPGNDSNVANVTAGHLATIDTNAPAAIFIQFDEVDGAGHQSGSASPNFAAEITDTDAHVGTLLDAVANRPNFANEDWQIIVTSDHGHTPGGGHGGQSALERRIPFIVASQSLNQGGLSPVIQQVSHADVAATVLEHFSLAIPSNYYGISRAGGATLIDPDINGDGVVSGDGTGTFENDDVVAFASLWLQPNTSENPNPADFNSDGIADLLDWAILNAENPSMGASIWSTIYSRTVPEPAALLLAAAGAACGIPCRRRP